MKKDEKMGKGRLSSFIFGKQSNKTPRKKKDAITQVVRSVERADLRYKNYYQRALDFYEKAQNAIRRNNEAEAKTHLNNWNYNKIKGDMYLQIQSNLQRQLDVMQETEDLRAFGNAFKTAQKIMEREDTSIPVSSSIQARSELRVKEVQTRNAMRVFSRQMGVSGSHQNVDDELERLRTSIASSPNVPIIETPMPSIPSPNDDRVRRNEEEKEKLSSQ